MKRTQLTFIMALMVAFGSCKKAIKLEELEEKPEQTLMATTFAGAGAPAFKDDVGKLAAFNLPTSSAVDASGNIFVSDSKNARIRKITPTGVVTTLAGSGTNGYLDGTGTAAQFGNGDNFLTVDGQGNVFLADVKNSCIRKITPTGVVTTLTGKPGIAANDGPIATAGFSFGDFSAGITIDDSNNIYVTDNKGIRKITPDGMVSTIIKKGSANVAGPIATATILNTIDVAVDASNNIYVAVCNDFFDNQSIQKITANGTVGTLAGNNPRGYLSGIGEVARFNDIRGIAIDKSGFLYTAESGNHVIRRINTSTGFVSHVAGIQYPTTVAESLNDGPVLEAKFGNPYDISINSKGDLFIVERSTCLIRKITLIDNPPKLKSKEEQDRENWNKPAGWK